MVLWRRQAASAASGGVGGARGSGRQTAVRLVVGKQKRIQDLNAQDNKFNDRVRQLTKLTSHMSCTVVDGKQPPGHELAPILPHTSGIAGAWGTSGSLSSFRGLVRWPAVPRATPRARLARVRGAAQTSASGTSRCPPRAGRGLAVCTLTSTWVGPF